MDRLMEILHEANEDINYEENKKLITDRLLTSIMVLDIVSEIEDEYDIVVTPDRLTAKNFDSAEAIWALICELRK